MNKNNVDLADPIAHLKTIRDMTRWAMTEMQKNDIFFGHGSEDAWEEATFLILRSLDLPFEKLEAFWDAQLTQSEREMLVERIARRVFDKIPSAYILNEAWLTEHRFYIDERALIPRSYLAELLEENLEPWIEDPYAIESVLDLCTGSGCLAILAQGTFENAQVTGSDLSKDALEVAKINRHDYDMDETLELVQGDLFENLQDRTFDLILSNPPYVPSASMQTLPNEYRHEPEMALGAGVDGMDVIKRMLPQAIDHLNPHGLLIVELGDESEALEALFPALELTWLSTSGGDDQVFMVTREALVDYFS